MQTVLKHAPWLAPLLFALWGDATVVIQCQGGSFTIVDGLWQGDVWSAVCFALAMLEVRS